MNWHTCPALFKQSRTRAIQFRFVFYCLHTSLPHFHCFPSTFLTPARSDPTQIKQNEQDLFSYTLWTPLAAQAGWLVPHLLQWGNYHLQALKVNKESVNIQRAKLAIASVVHSNAFSNSLWVCLASPFAICPACVQTPFPLAHDACVARTK